MPYALIIAGVVLTVAGVRNTEKTLFSLLKGDFTGSNSFIWWTVSILGIGAVGYVGDLRKLSNAFLALVLIVLIISNKGVFAQFTSALKGSIPNAPVANNTTASSTQTASNATANNTVADDATNAGALASSYSELSTIAEALG